MNEPKTAAQLIIEDTVQDICIGCHVVRAMENMMRQSDVELLLRRYGHERGVVHVLYRLAEEQRALENSVKEMALTFEAITKVVTMQNTVLDTAKDKIDAMGKHFDTDPRSTHAIVRSTGSDGDE